MRARIVDPFAPVRRPRRKPPAPPSAEAAEEALPAPERPTLANGLVGVRTAAVQLGMDPRAVAEECRAGTLLCSKGENGRWLVDVSVAQHVIAARTATT